MLPLSDFPSRPESALVRNSENTTTGFQSASFSRGNPQTNQPALYKGLKRRNNKNRPRAVHNFPAKPPELPEDSIFIHFQKEAKKDGASCVFLLWGSENSESSTTWAVDVPITDLESEDKVFKLLAEQYAAELGFWRRYLSFRKFSRLKPVTVCSILFQRVYLY
jgi:hypothetical protein